MKRLAFVLALLWSGGALAQEPKEITLPVGRTITLQVGETRVFQFGEVINRVGISDDNVVEVRSVQDHAFALKGTAMGQVTVTARSEDGSQVHRMRIVVGGRQVKVYHRYEPDYLSVNCDEYGCGPGRSSRPEANAKSTTIRTPTGGGGFVERTY